MAKRNASPRPRRAGSAPAAAPNLGQPVVAGGYDPGDNVLVQTRLPADAVLELKKIAKRDYTTVAAVTREMLLRNLGFLPAAAKETIP